MKKHNSKYRLLMTAFLVMFAVGILEVQAEENPWSSVTIESAMRLLFGTTKAAEDKRVIIIAPEVAANGGAVPVHIATSIPAKRIALFQDANPMALVAVWKVHENSITEYDVKIKLRSDGRPIRITAVVEGKDGRLYSSSETLIVALGGCDDGGGGYSSYSNSPARIQSYRVQPPRMPVRIDQPNTEEYKFINENTFKEVSSSPLSTFSIDVDTASYANVRRFISADALPPKDAVRIEEMVNYFDYDYKEPRGNKPFYINTQVGQSIWNKRSKTVQIGLQTKKPDVSELPASNLVFLLDISGSMGAENKLPLLIKSLSLLVEELREDDRVSIVVYAGHTGVVLDRARGDEKAKIKWALQNLRAGGSTAGGAGIHLAYDLARKAYIHNGNNRVILATDGDFNVGVRSESDLIELIQKKRKSGVFLSVLGFGYGNYKDNKMEALADKGNGNYYYIDSLLEAKKVLVTQMSGTLYTVAKDVKIQVEFNPAVVHSYRLLGYENRLMAKEDFNNDKKDAGEVGRGHRVTALYEVFFSAADANSGVDALKYQKHSQSRYENYDELATVKVRYKDPKEDRSQLMSKVITLDSNEMSKDDFYFAQSVAGFGMLLRGSEYANELRYSRLVELAKDSKGRDRDGHRAELIRMIEQAEMISH